MIRPSVLVFAGSDPSGGAGIQADIEAIAANGAHALAVITALTVQDNDRVYAVHPVPAPLVREQAQALIDKIAVAAVKIGIVANRANAQAIAGLIAEMRRLNSELPVVFDPVLAGGHGDALSVDDAVQTIECLIGIATVITPNLPEAAALCGGEQDARAQAKSLMQRGARHVLIKGGHGAQEDKVVNLWFSDAGERTWEWPRLAGAFHGSGCTLASSIAGLLAAGKTVEQAIDQGQAFTQRVLESSYAIAEGQRIPGRVAATIKE
jgi:hydroxymethylpyrimidine/phosphomethylpyrimidine kinase